MTAEETRIGCDEVRHLSGVAGHDEGELTSTDLASVGAPEGFEQLVRSTRIHSATLGSDLLLEYG